MNRRAFAQSPPRVEYALTPLGQSLVDGPMRALRNASHSAAGTLKIGEVEARARVTEMATAGRIRGLRGAVG